jgi:hypothetical protein
VTDVVILSVPRLSATRPQSACGILKSICNRATVPSQVFDLNLDFYQKFEPKNKIVADEVDQYWIQWSKELSPNSRTPYTIWMTKWIDRILALSPRMVAISVFSWESQRFCLDFLPLLKEKFNGTVIVGGQGLINEQNGSFSTRMDFAHKLKEQNLITHWLAGEAENSFYEFVTGNLSAAGINSDRLVNDVNLNQHNIADYSDFDIHSYVTAYPGGVLPIESSRGCVRACAFCDIPTHAGGFRYKHGQVMADEMIHYYKTYGVRNFYFNDALMNGSVKEFRIFLKSIVEFYRANQLPDRFFTFSGYWIVRSAAHFKETDFALLSQAGGEMFETGVETGSDRLRTIMRKGFSNEDLEFNISMFAKYKMKFFLLLLVGFPNETLDDFEETKNLLRRWQKYVAMGTIIGCNLGTGLTVEQGTPMFDDPKKFNLVPIKGETAKGINWLCTTTPELDYVERVRRRIELHQLATDLGYTVWKGDDHLSIIKDRYLVELANV